MDQIVFAHVSDVHIESNLFNHRFGLVAGWRGHDVTLCRGLQEAIEELPGWMKLHLGKGESIPFILTGDMTCYGRESDFATAHSFFRCKREIDLDRPAYELGLGLGPMYKLLAIPGNHDHWDGLKVPARPHNPRIFPTQFRTTPWYRPISSSSIEVQVFGIDSNSGLRGLSGQTDAILARGKVSVEELDKLEVLLQNAAARNDQAHVVRVLAVHHSFNVPSGMVGAQALNPESADRLLKLADQYGVAAILTGHIHQSLIWPHRVRAHGRLIWEIRAATTLQGPAGRQSEQGFFIHQLVLSGRKVVWRIWQYVWRGDAFLRSAVPVHEFDV